MTDKNRRKAVIDLGTNTFHLLIVEKASNGSWSELLRKREYVYLASSGMNKISDEAFDRGLQTLKHFKEVLEDYKVTDFKAIGTAALRTASNRQQFIETAKDVAGIKVQVIDGLEEAKFITKGVDLAIGDELQEYLIMDIGGGSVEFIHKSKNKILWEHSFALGLAVLKSLDFYEDPMTSKVVEQFKDYIHQDLRSLYRHMESHKTLPLIGASGTFEALLQILPSEPFGKKCQHYTFQALEKAYKEVVFLNIIERLSHPGIPKERAELFSIATLMVYCVAAKLKSADIYVSPYALKEGVLQSMK